MSNYIITYCKSGAMRWQLRKGKKYIGHFNSKASAQRAVARHKRKLAEDKLELMRIEKMEAKL